MFVQLESMGISSTNEKVIVTTPFGKTKSLLFLNMPVSNTE